MEMQISLSLHSVTYRVSACCSAHLHTRTAFILVGLIVFFFFFFSFPVFCFKAQPYAKESSGNLTGEGLDGENTGRGALVPTFLLLISRNHAKGLRIPLMRTL